MLKAAPQQSSGLSPLGGVREGASLHPTEGEGRPPDVGVGVEVGFDLSGVAEGQAVQEAA